MNKINKNMNIDIDYQTFKELNKCISIFNDKLKNDVSGKVIISRSISRYLKFLNSLDIDFLKENQFINEKKEHLKNKKDKTVTFKDNLENDKNTDTINIYTDGACTGNPGAAGIGIVILHNDEIKEYSEYIGEATNNIAELKAVKFALEKIKTKHAIINIFIDSKYTIGVLSQNWKPKVNIELIHSIKTIMKSFSNVNLNWTKGHSGNLLNEKADQLANDVIMKNLYKY